MRKQITPLRQIGSACNHAGSASSPSGTLGQAYVRRYAEMREFLRGRTGDAEAADDLIQSAWLIISPRADDSSIDNPDAWLQRVITNLALNWIKRNRFGIRLFDHDENVGDREDQVPAQDMQTHYRQSVRYLSQLIDELPPQRREVFLLYRGDGLSMQETADRLGVTVGTVHKQLKRAMTFLRKHMEEAGLWP